MILDTLFKLLDHYHCSFGSTSNTYPIVFAEVSGYQLDVSCFCISTKRHHITALTDSLLPIGICKDVWIVLLDIGDDTSFEFLTFLEFGYSRVVDCFLLVIGLYNIGHR